MADGGVLSEGQGATARAPARWGPRITLVGIVVTGFALYAALALRVDVPRVHPDEVRYAIAASSWVEGDGLRLRDGEYGFGPLYAALLASIIRATTSIVDAYDWFKIANALLFSLTALPVYALARRLLTPWWAVLVAGLAVAIPSSISVATVMTESLAYSTSALALLAVALALERPTVPRQLAVLGAIALAFLTRQQLAVLYLAWLLALPLLWLLVPGCRPRERVDLVRLWPSALPLLGAIGLFGHRSLSGQSPAELLGAYWELWRGYEVAAVAKWLVYHLGDFELYLAVVPIAVAPIVLWELARRARASDVRAGAFLALFLAANVTGLLVVAAFTSTPWGYDRLHDRYAFYLLPLWLVALVTWLAEGLPRPVLATAIGVVLALALPIALPFRQLANEAGIDTVPGALWVWIEERTAGIGFLSGPRVLGLFVLALLAVTVLLPRRYWPIVPALVLAVFALTSALAWKRMLDAPEDAVFAGGRERAWIDRHVRPGASVTKLYLESQACPSSALTRHALFLTEFFNASVDRAVYVGDSTPDGLPIERVDVGPDGVLKRVSGEPLSGEYVFTQPGIELAGRRVATGTNATLVLWEIEGPVRVVGVASNEELRTRDCA